MNEKVPPYCFQVIYYSSDDHGSANGIMVDADRGWFVVNEHFVSAGDKHFVLDPSTGKEHRLIVHKRLINKAADIALVSMEKPTALLNVQLPEYGETPTIRREGLLIAGHQTGVDCTMKAVFLKYPAAAGHLENPPVLSGYEGSIMCSHDQDRENLPGLSGSPVMNRNGSIVGILSNGKLNIIFITPSFEIAKLLKKARKGSITDLSRKIVRALWK